MPFASDGLYTISASANGYYPNAVNMLGYDIAQNNYEVSVGLTPMPPKPWWEQLLSDLETFGKDLAIAGAVVIGAVIVYEVLKSYQAHEYAKAVESAVKSAVEKESRSNG